MSKIAVASLVAPPSPPLSLCVEHYTVTPTTFAAYPCSSSSSSSSPTTPPPSCPVTKIMSLATNHLTLQHSSFPLKSPPQKQMNQGEWFEENGRLYHTWHRGLYMFPLDEQEQERMDIYHNLLYRIAGLSLHGPRLTPAIHSKPRIMDVGCGTGHWAVSIADDYPQAEVLGLDLANIQPAQIPANVQFQIPTNIEGHWTFGQDSWDLIHLSALLGSVSSWPNMYGKVFSHLRPGYGYIQHIEIDYRPRCDDGTMSADGWLSRWYGYLVQATDQTNKPIAYREDTRELLRQAGFVDITERVIQAPLCSWNEDPMHFNIANYHQVCMDSCFGLEALSLALFSRLWNWDLNSIKGLVEAARTEIRTKAIHEYNNIHVWSARRPAY